MNEYEEIHGVKLIRDRDMVLHHQKRTGESFEAVSVDLWKRLVNDCKEAGHGSILIDIGAYTGLYSLLAAKEQVNCFAFEPNKDAFFRLLENMSLNESYVCAFPFALGDVNGKASLKKCGRASLTSAATIKANENGRTEIFTLDYFLDHYTKGWDDIKGIKIDVKRYEVEVLKGALSTIERFKPILITEGLSQQEINKQSEILYPLGYEWEHSFDRNVHWYHAEKHKDWWIPCEALSNA